MRECEVLKIIMWLFVFGSEIIVIVIVVRIVIITLIIIDMI